MDTNTHIGIVGAGTMGIGIAQVAATAGHKVFLYDNDADVRLHAAARLNDNVQNIAKKKKWTDPEAEAVLARITFMENMDAFRTCELVVEAIVEDLKQKMHTFEGLEVVVPTTSILATNTSSLSITSIAAGCKEPQRVVGIHFFNPAPLMQLVEIIPAIQTSPEVIAQAQNIIKSWGKTTVLAKDTPGFIVNRVARPFYSEALRILEEGVANFATIDWAMKQMGGFRMGPFELMDFIGQDVNYKVTETVYQSFFYDPRYKPSFSQKRLVEAGFLGRKSGRGFYDYDTNAEKPQPREDKNLGTQIVQRIVTMLTNEAADAVFWNVATKEDVDLAMTLGVNYPKGLLQWADEIGIQKVVETMDNLYDFYREDRYRCSPLLRKMAKLNERFY
jgi:3-hydroxybutyryl-CoA dehydrogenase